MGKGKERLLRHGVVWRGLLVLGLVLGLGQATIVNLDPGAPDTPVKIRHVLAVMTSTGVNIRNNLMSADTGCDIMPNYCLTMRAQGGLHGDQVSEWVRSMNDLGNFDALVLYDEANTIRDGGSAEKAKNEHEATVSWVKSHYPRLMVLPMTVLDELTPDPWGQKAKERAFYNQDLISRSGEKVIDGREVVDQNCFGSTDRLHIIKECQIKLVGKIKTTLDGLQIGQPKR